MAFVNVPAARKVRVTAEGHLDGSAHIPPDLDRLRYVVRTAVTKLFGQIRGGRIRCESEATLQLHLGRIIAAVADLEIVDERETLSIELEKPLADTKGRRGRIDIWFRITDRDGVEARCAVEMKFFKRANQREPNNRYDVFSDIARLERCGDVADLGFMLVATDHAHYVGRGDYRPETGDFDFRHGRSYAAGTMLSYRTPKPHGPPIKLVDDYTFIWSAPSSEIPVASPGEVRYMLLEVRPTKVESK